MDSVKIVSVLCLLTHILVSAADDDSFPVISWYQLERTPFASSSGSSAPACVDFDGDGDFDCFIGTAAGDIEYYENTGTPSAFKFTHNSSMDIPGTQGYSKPVIADFNGDGDLDFYIGGYDGKVSLLLNNGDGTYTEDGDDVFGSAIKKYKSGASGGMIKGARGAAAITIPLAVTGLTSVGVGALGSVLMMLPTAAGASSSLGSYASPTCADLDGDGDLDCVVGYYDGSCALFMNTGTSAVASFKLTINDLFKGTYDSDARMASPFLRDFDGDGDIDVVVGLDDGEVYYYENIAGVNATTFAREDFTLQSSDLFGSVSSVNANAAPWCGQTDGDSKVECFVGSENGTAWVYDSELPDPTPAPAVSMPPSMSPTMIPYSAPTTMSPSTSANPVGGNNKENSVAMGSTGVIIAVVVSIFLVLGAGVAVCMSKRRGSNSSENDAFDQMQMAAVGGKSVDSLALFSAPQTESRHGGNMNPINSNPAPPSPAGAAPTPTPVGPPPGVLHIQSVQVTPAAPPPAVIQQAPVPPPVAVAVRAEEYDDEEVEVRVFSANAVRGNSARMAVAHQQEQQQQEYRSVNDEKYSEKMASQLPRTGMYTANNSPPPLPMSSTEQYMETRVSSIDAMVEEAENKARAKEDEEDVSHF